MVSSGSYPLYDFLMREDHPTWGRWISPDPAGLAAANPANPQTWNRYAYVGNNPLSFTDPLGLKCVNVGTPQNPIWGDDGTPPACNHMTVASVTTVVVRGQPVNACTDPQSFEASYGDGAPCLNYNPNPGYPTSPTGPKRHRGSGHPPTPATPPCVRVRTRRFGG